MVHVVAWRGVVWAWVDWYKLLFLMRLRIGRGGVWGVGWAWFGKSATLCPIVQHSTVSLVFAIGYETGDWRDNYKSVMRKLILDGG
jgi:hypothetical protein